MAYVRYEGAVYQLTVDFSEHAAIPITELEAFTGSIFNKSGSQTRRQRESSLKLKDEIDRILQWIVRTMRKTGTMVDGVDGASEAEPGATPLELSIACLNVATTRPAPRLGGGGRHGGGDYQSFKIVAASCALRELDVAVKRWEIAEGAALAGGGYVGVRGGLPT